ncbi:hypothetical protein J6590_062289 [Homalodisca vitripennis]|nr:hypothetical protein J6590_062289 [Homalodisca vitripennis]
MVEVTSRVPRLMQDNGIKQRRAWLLLGGPLSDPVLTNSPAVGSGSQVTFKVVGPQFKC